MGSKKVFELLNLLRELVSAREISVKNYALNSGLSERTIRRYLNDLKSFFGEESIMITSRGTHSVVDKNLISTIMLPNQSEKEEFEKLIDLLHIINPGFTSILPPAYKHIDDRLSKELAQVFLIKGSPHEKNINLKILSKLEKAIKFRKYCDLYVENTWLKQIKPLKIIYCKGNWQLALIDANDTSNNGFKVIRLCFINEVALSPKTFNISAYTENFIRNLQSFWDGYKVAAYECEVAVAPCIEKYFRQKKFFSSQRIGEKFKNGWVKVIFEITRDDMILMLARRWFPHFVVLSPKSARDKFDTIIKEYEKFSNFKF
ncbi:helix-turn-helix transcriptional regulator [Campylobacter curvus]|uniref:helix-turn-helix transcriptional regulator n=1 Tax=Campylobacter curvus TaxID=200 RepID=UPI000372F7B5|nr:WYL domain-containing protein [Campylobacter curvus]QKF61994.1 transcriptional regulator (WYL domain) [Campylobacter curvus]UEB50282.1 WYL domain-containing protein [Campylobacter curvus]